MVSKNKTQDAEYNAMFSKTSDALKVNLDFRLKPYEFHREYTKQVVQHAVKTGLKRNRLYAEILINFLKNAHVIEIDERLIPIIEHTVNKTDFYRPLFFEQLFINTDFHIETDWILKGISIVDKGDDWVIESMLQHIPTRNGTYVVNTLLEENELNFGEATLNKIYKKATKHLRMMCCNIIDLVENTDEDIDITKIIPSKEQQEKRKKREKSLLPTKIFIRPKTHFIEYLSHLSTHNSPSHEFEVMGHWRHYRNERYSEKLRKKPQWIKQHWKGEGIRIVKPHKIVPGELAKKMPANLNNGNKNGE